jgi:two-component system NtrC family sensor kinase
MVKKNQELEDTLTRLRETQGSLIEQQKLAELGTFSAGIAHEIRNPLGLIRSHLRNVQETRDPLVQESAIRGIERQIRRTSDFIDKLLSYARPSAPMRRRMDVNRTVSMAARFASEAFSPKKQIELRREFEPDLPPILADHAQLQEVFINIITNALEAIGSRGIIWLKTARHEGDGVRIDIIDTGPGLQEEMILHIFQPFFTSGKGSKGTGMGLAIARRIVEGHRGQIEAACASGAGMRFSVFLPEE